jgi:hypothetical protein
MNGTGVIGVQKRMMQLGRVRIGEKGPKGEPRKIDSFRFTSASKALLEAVATTYGGKVTEWEGAPDEGYFQVTTEAKELRIILPPVFSAADGSPTTSYSQWYELWSGGGCQRRCDGQTESLSGQACMCNPDDRACDITTRVSFMLPEIPGLGVWRLDSKGWNAAVELPGTLEVLMMAAARNTFVPAVLRIENRTKKEPGKGTRRFVVPVLDLPDVKIGDLLAAAGGQSPLAINMPKGVTERPALPAAGGTPADPKMDDPDGKPEFGTPPALDAEVVDNPPGDYASEADVTDVLEIAASINAETHDNAVAAIAKHRKENGGMVQADWLKRKATATLKKASATVPA